MLKITGVILIIAGCLGAGRGRTMQEKQRIWYLRELLHILKRIEAEIRYGKRTMPEICALLSEQGKGGFRDCFCRIYERLQQKEGIAMERIWKEEVKKCFSNLPLREEEGEILLAIPSALGMAEADIQAEQMQQFSEQLERRLRLAEEEYEGKTKMIWSVSALAGAFLVIILL